MRQTRDETDDRLILGIRAEKRLPKRDRGSDEAYTKRICGVLKEDLRERRKFESSPDPSTEQTVSNFSVPQRSWCARRSRRHPSPPGCMRTCAFGFALGDRLHGVFPPPASAHFGANRTDSFSVSLKSGGRVNDGLVFYRASDPQWQRQVRHLCPAPEISLEFDFRKHGRM